MSELPSGWVEEPLSEVCELITDGTHHSPSNGAVGEFKYVTAKNIRKHGLDLSNITYVDAATHREIYKRCPVKLGDVLYIKDGATTGLAIVNPLEEEFSMLSSVALLRPAGTLLNAHFLRHQLNSRSLRERMTGDMTGSAIRRLTLTTIGRQEVAVPPLAEQKRIVAKLDALNAKSARARTELARIETLVSRYKQAALSKAFSGELTRKWRDIQANAPGWSKAVISDIAEVVTGSTPKTAEKDRFFGGDTPFFKPTDLDQGYHVETPRETLSAAGVAVSRLVPALSVLVTCIGATIGKVGFARVACCTNQQINTLVPKIALAKPEWLYWVVSSPEFQAIIIGNSSATTLPIINKGRFQQLPLDLPPLEEQHEIVRRIEAAFDRIDRLAKEAKRALELVGRLDEAILAKAFRGELLPQDANDEPASLLLQRIRQADLNRPAAIKRTGPKRQGKNHDMARTEPPRVFRRPFRLSHAAMAG